ncbi:MAG: CBS domain-containing protein [Gemmatimonadales bacterium]
MTKDVFTVRANQRVVAAEEIMRWAHVRHVPVLDDHHCLVGIVSQRDVLRAAISSLSTGLAAVEKRQHLASVTIGQIMSHPVHTISPRGLIQEAAGTMRRLRIGCLPVVEDDRCVGMVSEHDLLAVLEHLPTRSLDERVAP